MSEDENEEKNIESAKTQTDEVVKPNNISHGIPLIPGEDVKTKGGSNGIKFISEDKSAIEMKGINIVLKYLPDITKKIAEKGKARYTIPSMRKLFSASDDTTNEILAKQLNDLLNEKGIKIEIDMQNKDAMTFLPIEEVFKVIHPEDRRGEIDSKITNIKKDRDQMKVTHIENKFHMGYTGNITHVPIHDMLIPPLGCDPVYKYTKLFPIVHLPFQPIERVSFSHTDIIPNRLIWGDNLHTMRQLPNECIDLIYIDPPFFSNRNYAVIWGDDNEIRSFVDMWDGGMKEYLIWLNARLLEMKRLLKPSGSIYIHLDWHAVHYVKVEMDKIFGYENFMDDIAWCYEDIGGKSPKYFKRKYDHILFYVNDNRYSKFNPQYKPLSESTVERYRKYFDNNGKLSYRRLKETNPGVFQKLKGIPNNLDEIWLDMNRGQPFNDWWTDISAIRKGFGESIGYPTQKPEKMIERIIRSSTDPGDTVADFFVGGGTTLAVAQRLDRKWIGCDISRIAIAVARDRLLGVRSKRDTTYQSQLEFIETPDILVEYWGCYEIDRFNKLSDEEFKDFIIKAYDAIPANKEEMEWVHAYKGNVPIYIGNKSIGNPVTPEIVISFANNLVKYQKKKGIIIAWEFTPQAREAIGLLKNDKNISINTIEISLIPIDSKEFRSHIIDKSYRYSDILTFMYQPDIKIRQSRLGPLYYRFDIRETISKNGPVLNVQWDFNYNGDFKSTKEYTFTGKNKRLPEMTVDYRFDYPGNRKIACKVQDIKGGESIKIINLQVG